MMVNSFKLDLNNEIVDINFTRKEILDLRYLLESILFRPMDHDLEKYTYFIKEQSLSSHEKFTLKKESFERLVKLKVKLELNI